MTVKVTLLVNLQDFLRFGVTVGLSICRKMIFVSLCRLEEQYKELTLIRGTVMTNKGSIVPHKLQHHQGPHERT